MLVFQGFENLAVVIVPAFTHWSELMLDLAPHGWIPNAGVPAAIVAGAGVSLAVNPALVVSLASVIQTPIAGFINLPDEVAVITYPVEALVETCSCCAALFTAPLLKTPKFTDVAVVAMPVLVVIEPQLALMVLIFVLSFTPAIVKVKVGSTVA